MSFLAPIAFLFALALPVVVVFYLLKRRRVTRLTSSTLLWKRYLSESQANSPFQRLRNHWLMLLQLLLLALLMLALTRPFMKGSARPARLRVLVLDASASMQATDVTPSRFAAAKQEALDWVQGLKDGEQAMVLWAGSTAVVKQSPTSDKTVLTAAIEACQVSDGSTRLKEAIQTATAFTYEKRGEETAVTGEIHLFSDGAASDLASFENRNLPLVYHRIGKSRRNLGIVAMDIRANPESPEDRAVFLSIANASSEPLSTEVDLLWGNQIIQTQTVQVEGSNQTSVVFKARQQVDGVFTARLRLQDELAVDNQASLHSLLPRPIPVILVTRGNRFLEKGLRGIPYVELQTVLSLSGSIPEAALVVLDGITPDVWPSNPVLAFLAVPTHALSEITRQSNPLIVDWHRSHPVMRSVAMDNVDLAEGLLPKAPSWGVSLVQSQERPLILAGDWDQRRLVWIGFDALQSNWPLRVSFPIFLANAVEWLNPASTRSSEKMLRPGDAVRLAVRAPIKGIRVVRPDGKVELISSDKDSSEFVYGSTDRQGLYRFEWEAHTNLYCVNLLDSFESNIQPRDELPFGKYESAPIASLKPSGRELWRLFAATALGFLLFEWWYFHRRTA
jgi:Ca-activated chloride channel homolog